uniref:Secreted protein n=1 Tax=Steinernema glaseri TaxID=37863 RepID=A0A1I7Z0C0_9BILA
MSAKSFFPFLLLTLPLETVLSLEIPSTTSEEPRCPTILPKNLATGLQMKDNSITATCLCLSLCLSLLSVASFPSRKHSAVRSSRARPPLLDALPWKQPCVVVLVSFHTPFVVVASDVTSYTLPHRIRSHFDQEREHPTPIY